MGKRWDMPDGGSSNGGPHAASSRLGPGFVVPRAGARPPTTSNRTGSTIVIGLVIGVVIATAALLVADELTDHPDARALDLTTQFGGTSSRTVTVDGRDRTYTAYVPNRLPVGPVPLVLGLHGATGSGRQFEEASRLDAVADELGFVVVYPDGVDSGDDPAGSGSRTWNAGDCCGQAEIDDVDDVSFIDEVIDDVDHDLVIDPARIFAVGYSNGGMLAYRLACELSDRIAGIAVFGATLEVDLCEPSRPVSLLVVHGTEDQNVPYDGGSGTRSITGTPYRPVPAALDVFLHANGCAPNPVRGTDLRRKTTHWRSCDEATAIRQVILVGASHTWPTGEGSASTGYDASAEMAEWLLEHPRRPR